VPSTTTSLSLLTTIAGSELYVRARLARFLERSPRSVAVTNDVREASFVSILSAVRRMERECRGARRVSTTLAAEDFSGLNRTRDLSVETLRAVVRLDRSPTSITFIRE
jgi:hypothetical protein